MGVPLHQGIPGARLGGNGLGEGLFVEAAAAPRDIGVVDLVRDPEVLEGAQQTVLDTCGDVAATGAIGGGFESEELGGGAPCGPGAPTQCATTVRLRLSVVSEIRLRQISRGESMITRCDRRRSDRYARPLASCFAGSQTTRPACARPASGWGITTHTERNRRRLTRSGRLVVVPAPGIRGG